VIEVLDNELGPVMVDAKFLAMCPYNWTRNSSLINSEDEHYDKVAQYHEMLRADVVIANRRLFKMVPRRSFSNTSEHHGVRVATMIPRTLTTTTR
jgi:hypothetical protein